MVSVLAGFHEFFGFNAISTLFLRRKFVYYAQPVRDVMHRAFRILVFAALMGFMAVSSPRAAEDDAKKAQEEIQQAGMQWTVEWTRGVIQYKLRLTLNGSSADVIGSLSGEGVIRLKDRTVRITVQMQLTGGRFHYITHYPSMTFTYVGRMTSSDPQAFPVRENVQFQDSLLLKEGKLCPLSVRQNPQCMVPEKI